MTNQVEEWIHPLDLPEEEEKAPRPVSGIEMELEKQLLDAQMGLERAEVVLLTAVVQQIEATAAKDTAERTVEALEAALRTIRGESAPEAPQAPKAPETPTASFPPDYSDRTPERVRELQEAETRLREKTAEGPACPSCRRKGTIGRMEGTTMPACTTCGSLII